MSEDTLDTIAIAHIPNSNRAIVRARKKQIRLGIEAATEDVVYMTTEIPNTVALE